MAGDTLVAAVISVAVQIMVSRGVGVGGCWKSTQACQAKCSTWTHSQALRTWFLKAEDAEALADDIVFLPCEPSSGALRKRCWSLTVHKEPGGSPWCFVLLSASSPGGLSMQIVRQYLGDELKGRQRLRGRLWGKARVFPKGEKKQS